jgi:hypothetical protein
MYADNIAWFQHFERSQNIGNERKQIVEVRCAFLQCYFTITQSLLVLHIAVHGNQDFEPQSFRSGKKLAVGHSFEPRVPASPTIVTGYMVPQRFVNAFVEQDAHLMTGEQRLFGFLDGV